MFVWAYYDSFIHTPSGPLNPQTTLHGPLDPTQHSNSCKSETENDPAEIFQVNV